MPSPIPGLLEGQIYNFAGCDSANRAAVNAQATPASGAWSSFVTCAALVDPTVQGIVCDVTLIVTATGAGALTHEVAFSDKTVLPSGAAFTPSILTGAGYITVNTTAVAGNTYTACKQVIIPLGTYQSRVAGFPNPTRGFFYYSISKTNIATATLYVVVKGVLE
jgi:hypothetical protein